MVVDTDRVIEGLRFAELLRSAARDTPVLEHPSGYLLLHPILQGDLLPRPGHGEDHRVAQVPVLGSDVEDHVPIEEGDHLVGGDADDLLLAARLLQELVSVEEDLGAERLMGGAASVLLQAVGQRPRDEGGDQHDAEGDHILRFIGVEAELGFDKEPVEEEHAEQRADDAEHGAYRDHGDDEHAQDEHRDDVGFRESEPGEDKAHHRGRHQQQHRQQQVLP